MGEAFSKLGAFWAGQQAFVHTSRHIANEYSVTVLTVPLVVADVVGGSQTRLQIAEVVVVVDNNLNQGGRSDRSVDSVRS